MRRLFALLACTCTGLALACSTPSTGTPSSGSDAGNILPDGSVNPYDGKASDGIADIADAVSDSTGTAFNCTSGEKACFNDHVAKICVDGHWLANDQCADGDVCLNGTCIKPTDNCTPGKTKCDGYAKQLTCNAAGNAWVPNSCPGKQQCAMDSCKDVACTPYVNECAAANSFHTCKADGSGFEADVSCKSGAMCLGGKCLSLCETNLKISSNVGCEYWSVDLDNSPDTFSAMFNKEGLTPDMIPYSIVIANPGIFDAEITFEVASTCANGDPCAPINTCGGKKGTVCSKNATPYKVTIVDNIVTAGGSKEFKMPVMNVDGSGIFAKAIHVKSTQPVVAFQFNPFNSEGAASNDASLLLPVNSLGKTYFGVASASTPMLDFPGMPKISQNGYVTAVATSPGKTEIQVYPKAKVIANPSAGVGSGNQTALDPNKVYVFTLNQYDVLNLEALGELSFTGEGALTGTRFDADKPIAVFSGHEETVIGPDGATKGSGTNGGDGCCAEHVEEQMMPLESWGNAAFCTKTKPRGTEADQYTLVAGDDNTTLTTVPPIKGLDGVVMKKAGDSLTVQTSSSFMLTATGRVQVVQFIFSAGYTDQGVGDPSMMIVPPSSQYRADYVVQTADGYGKNWTTLVRPKGIEIKMDGVVVPDSEFSPFGDGSWEIAYQEMVKGTHAFEGKASFGLMVYGYGNKTAYSYPGGMNLK